MTADVNQDRRVTGLVQGLNLPALSEGSRLFWALLSPVHERLGYRVLAPDRIQGDAIFPHSFITAQSRITSRCSCRCRRRNASVKQRNVTTSFCRLRC